MELTTPALLFPAITLLLLAYTNRFLALATLIRRLHREYREAGHERLLEQIVTLRRRLTLTRNMQAFGVASLLLCVVSMFLIFEGLETASRWVFGVSLLSAMTSLAFSLWEIQLSARALDVELSDIREGR